MKEATHKILLIEDDKLDQMAFTRMVQEQSLNYDCKIAKSVSEGVEHLSSEDFDAIISDYSLGDGTAFDILESSKLTPVIIITGAGDEEVAVKAWKAGAYDYLIKDAERNYLKTLPITVENAIRYRKTEQQARLLSAAVMSTSDSVYITDLDGKIIFVNKAFCRTYGYEESEVTGKSSQMLWMGKPEHNYTRSVLRTSVGGDNCQVAFYHKRKDGSVFPVSLSRSQVKDSSRKCIAVIGVVRDISEMVEVEDKLKSLHAKLRQQESRLTI